MKKPIVAGNWKMHKTPSETGRFVRELRERLGATTLNPEIIIAPPFVCVPVAVEAAAGSAVAVACQNLHWEDKGAYTGEISGAMIKDVGCTHVIIGHSERRQYFGETDTSVNKKIAAALRHDLVPIFCLGETLGEREQGMTFDVVIRQLHGGLSDIRPTDPKRLVIAYEPVWAIGTGKTATQEQAQEVHAFLRGQLSGMFGSDFAQQVRILYGGSIKPSNAAELFAAEDIDGGLVGGACLQIEDFVGIIEAAR
ncbi:MAG: triose-phosphate isomerase [Desulfomonile sp.]|nr:triose-phosphate isomerase [Desulfomonile sp.]